MTSYINFYHWKWIPKFFLTCLVSPFLLWTESPPPIAKKAETLFHEKLYGDALPLYSQLFALSQDQELKTEWALRLATCQLEQEQPQIALELLSSLNHSCGQTLYLMSLAHRQLGQPQQALHLLQKCTLPYTRLGESLIALEKGCHLMQMGDFEHARIIFNSIPKEIDNPLPYTLAQFQQAKIFLLNHHYQNALKTLNSLSPTLSDHPYLNIEKTYLKGCAQLGLKQEAQAILCFEELLPKALAQQTNWSSKTLKALIVSYLREGIRLNQSDQLTSLLSKADPLLKELIKREPTESSYHLLSDFYLIKAKYLSDPQAYSQAKHLLNKTELFSSADGLKEALLKQAAAAPSYSERSLLYTELSSQPDLAPSFLSKVWFLTGMNDLEEGLRNQTAQSNQMLTPFKQAAHAFTQTILIEPNPEQLALAYKYLTLTYIHLSEPSYIKLAWQTLDHITTRETLLETFEYPEEIHCLSAWIALHLNEREALKKGLTQLQLNPPKNRLWQERYLKLEGLINMQLGEWQQADVVYQQLLQNTSFTSSHGEAWFWRGYCAGQQQQESLQKEYYQQAYTQDSRSAYAPLAYFHFYSYRDYMQGKRKAIKHLEAMPHLFPNQSLLIHAYYLIGLYNKKDHLSEEGHIVRRKDLTAAIDAFQLAESTFDALFEKKLISATHLNNTLNIRYQAYLERAEANLAIAKQSTGGKKHIYLEYAENVFKQLIQEFTYHKALAKQLLVKGDNPYPKIWAKAELGLAKTYKEKNDWKKAESILNDSLTHYREAHIIQGEGLMHLLYAKGMLARRQANHELALSSFLEAEKAGQGLLILNPNEKLDLWIQQSLCYKDLNKLDQSMRILSQVINDDVISTLRIKAMFLRAEIYELQGRPELALKQLDAAAHKGGEWAKQAKEKLEKSYGY